MRETGRKLYFDKFTGDVIIDTFPRYGDDLPTTVEEDFLSYEYLSERNPETVGCLQLDYGQHDQQFAKCNGYSINLDKLEVVFTYPEQYGAESQEPIY